MNTTAPIGARLDRLPLSRLHVRALAVVGLAHVFDAFDALAVAFVLPSLITEWGISAVQAGVLLSVGYVGQLVGAVAMSALAERIGRRAALRLALFILSVLSLACAVAPSYPVLLALRCIQGIGLGGEVPIAASYLNEICPARYRGRVIFLLQTLFGTGALLTAAVAGIVIPRFGWQALFLTGTLPFLLALLLNRLVPESPRWLAASGRIEEADAVVTAMETDAVARGGSLPPPMPSSAVQPITRGASVEALFENGYALRTLSAWLMAFCASLAGYGILSWMPTLYTSVYHLPLQQARSYNLAPGIASVLGALAGSALIDALGRRRSFTIAFTGGALAIAYLAFMTPPALIVMLLSGVAMFFLTVLLSGIYLYAPEIYPTRMRALGTGCATAWMRIASIVGPLVVGFLLSRTGVSTVFMFFALAAAAGAFVTGLLVIETRGRRLEDIAQ
jgi:putative MFS transporter